MATRRERVVLELEDQFTTRMARAAAVTAVLNKELDSLSRESVKTQRSFSDIDKSTNSFGRNADRAGSQIDRLSGRLRVLTDVATLLTPAGIAVGAVAVPAVTALASQLGFAALAGGTAVIAFQGIGDALKALDKAALDPTRENLEAANLAMQKLSPAARQFAQEVRDLIPEAQRLRNVAAEGLFPGVVQGLEQLETALPRVESIVAAVSRELGDIAANTGASLASDRWAPFLEFIAREAPQALADMAAATGNVAHGLASMWMAFEPLNDDFSNWLVEATADLDRWASGLSQTEGFREFVDFIGENGPQVADTFGAIATAVIQVVEAAAPLSGPVLQGIEALANAVAALADSDLGTPLFTAVAALALFNRTMAVATAGRNGLQGFGTRLDTAGVKAKGLGANLRTTAADFRVLSTTALTAGARTERELLRMNTASSRLKANLGGLSGVGKGAGVLGGLTVASTGLADGIGLTNTASLALMGTIAGPWGAAIGAGVGAVLDFKAADDKFTESLRRADDAMNANVPSVERLSTALVGLKKQRDKLQDDFVGGRGGGGQLRVIDEFNQKIADTKKALDFQVAADRSKANLDFLSQGFHSTSTGLDAATQSAEDFKNSLDKINQVMTGRSTFRDYEQALDDFAARTQKRAELRAKIVEAEAGVSKARADLAAAKTPAQTTSAQASLKSARDNVASLRKELESYKNTLDTTTQAGRDTQASIDAIATSAINYAKSIQDPALRAAFLDNARDQYIKASIDAGASKKAAADLAKQIGLLNGIQGKVTITVDASGAVHIISELDERLRRLQRRLNRVQAAKNRAELADIRGDFWTGGWTGPGSKYQPAGVVHADEFVFSKEATNGNVAFLDALHRQMRGYADGGLVRRMPTPSQSITVSPGSTSLSDQDISRLVRGLATLRPVVGAMTVQPHNYNEFLRQQEAVTRAAAIGGIPR